MFNAKFLCPHMSLFSCNANEGMPTTLVTMLIETYTMHYLNTLSSLSVVV